jgi:hypothetical protein
MCRVFQQQIIKGEQRFLYGRTPTALDDFKEIPADHRSSLKILDWQQGTAVVLNSLPLRQWPGFYKQPDFMRFNDLARQVDVRNITPQYWSIHAKLEETQTQMTTNWSPRRFASSYFAAQAKAGEIPTQVGLVKAAQRAGLKGRREELRKEFKDWHRRAGRVMRRGPPAK